MAIDVNSGRATRERNIEQTALKTNLEAADEAARQMRLRDLAGLIVIDFIDMEEPKNDRAVEKRMKDNLRFDRARVQMGKISGFGLLELSRQRRRTGVLEGTSHVCEHCQGSGRVRSVESAALALLRALDEAAAKAKGPHHRSARRRPTSRSICSTKSAKRWRALKPTAACACASAARRRLHAGDFEINVGGDTFEDAEVEEAEAEPRAPCAPCRSRSGSRGRSRRRSRRGRRRRRRRGRRTPKQPPPAMPTSDDRRRRRRRGRRGGRRRREDGDDAASKASAKRPTAQAKAGRAPHAKTRRTRAQRQTPPSGRGRGGGACTRSMAANGSISSRAT